ncbi:hypothetical protein, partial [Enterobacter asburiae]
AGVRNFFPQTNPQHPPASGHAIFFYYLHDLFQPGGGRPTRQHTQKLPRGVEPGNKHKFVLVWTGANKKVYNKKNTLAPHL